MLWWFVSANYDGFIDDNQNSCGDEFYFYSFWNNDEFFYWCNNTGFEPGTFGRNSIALSTNPRWRPLINTMIKNVLKECCSNHIFLSNYYLLFCTWLLIITSNKTIKDDNRSVKCQDLCVEIKKASLFFCYSGSLDV